MCEHKHQIEVKKREIHKLQGKEKSIAAAFRASLGENNKFEEFLTRVFKKKIKRVKKKETSGSKCELSLIILTIYQNIICVCVCKNVHLFVFCKNCYLLFCQAVM